MASGVDSKETLVKEEDTFENLRATATCPICMEFYTNPKKVCKYSHVLCLNCLKCYLQANSHVNYPGCPVCRNPILQPRARINDLEPACAEKYIVSFVKQFETCGLCYQKENPNLECFQCGCLICENCKPSHSKLKPSHIVRPLMQPVSYKLPHTKLICQQHPEMSLDLFCIVCQTLLCSYCEKFSHAECRVRCYDQRMISRFNFGFLQKYVKDKDSVVYLKDFVKEAKSWIENIKIAVDECINFYKEYQSNIATVIQDQFEPRVLAIPKDSSDILKKCETVYADIVKLHESATDPEVAISILEIEQKAFQLFMRRQTHSMDIRPLKVAFDNGVIFRQISTGYLQIPEGAFAGMLCMAYIEPYDQIYSEHLQLKRDNCCTEAESNTAVHECKIDKGVTVYHYIVSFYEKIDRKLEQESEPLTFWNYLTGEMYEFCFTSSVDICFSRLNNNVHTSEILDSTKLKKFDCTIYPRTIDKGYEDYYADRRHFDHLVLHFYMRMAENGSPKMVMKLPNYVQDLRHFRIVTSFSNVFVVPFLFSVTGVYKPAPYYDTDNTPSLICVIGNRDSISGLETMFLYFDKTVQQFYGVCLDTSIVKFISLTTINLQKQHVIKSVKNKSSTYSFFSVEAEDCFMASIRTQHIPQHKRKAAPKNFLVAYDSNEKSERIIPVTFETVSLFCSTKKGLYFVKHDDKLDIMIIGKMAFSSAGMDTEVIFSVHEADVGIPICKLKPLTMVGNGSHDIVIVCAIENDSSSAIENDRSNVFIMIWPYKEANNRVEVLEVQCPNTVLSNASVVDLEMDPDGNIMYVLENQEGQSQSVCAKYFMPK